MQPPITSGDSRGNDARAVKEAKQAHRKITRWLEWEPRSPAAADAAVRVKCALYMRAHNPRSDSITRHLAEVTDEMEAAWRQSSPVTTS